MFQPFVQSITLIGMRFDCLSSDCLIGRLRMNRAASTTAHGPGKNRWQWNKEPSKANGEGCTVWKAEAPNEASTAASTNIKFRLIAYLVERVNYMLVFYASELVLHRAPNIFRLVTNLCGSETKGKSSTYLIGSTVRPCDWHECNPAPNVRRIEDVRCKMSMQNIRESM